jgi:hypothetical protein
MDTNEIQAALAGYLEQVRTAAYHEGRIAGRKEARDELRFFFDKFEEAFPIEPVEKRQRRASRTAPQTGTVWPSPDQVMPMIKQALATLALAHPEGASPQTIAEQLRPNGQPINVQAVRQALRQLNLQGEVRRVAHARYLPAAPPVAQEPQTEAAE